MDSDQNKSVKKKNTSVITSDIIEFSFIWILYFGYYSKLVYKTVNGNYSYIILFYS